jgi:hypothetical protein
MVRRICYRVIIVFILSQRSDLSLFFKLLVYGGNYALSCESSNMLYFYLMGIGWYCAILHGNADGM